MKLVTKIVTALILASSFAAAEYIGTYYAKLGESDHYNSRGTRLHNVAAIIRQDRFNFHVRGIRQSDDTWDPFFGRKYNRAAMEAMLRAGTISRYARERILYAHPLIKVDVYSNHVNVRVMHQAPQSTIR